MCRSDTVSHLTTFSADSHPYFARVSEGSTAWQTPTCIPDDGLCSSSILKNESFGKVRQIDSVSTLAPDDDEIDELDELEELEELWEADELAEFEKLDELDGVAILRDDEVVEVFKAFDKNGDGLVKLSDVQSMLRDAGADLTDDEFNEAMGDLFADCDGQIDVKLFGAAFLGEDVSNSEDASAITLHPAASVAPPSSVDVVVRDADCFSAVHHAVRSFFRGY